MKYLFRDTQKKSYLSQGELPCESFLVRRTLLTNHCPLRHTPLHHAKLYVGCVTSVNCIPNSLPIAHCNLIEGHVDILPFHTDRN